jgi:transcriptional regulator with XRE-family HTH domain
MPAPEIQNPIQQAVRELRKHQQRSQQAMATALGLSMGALRNYESGTVTTPDPRPLYAFLMQAEGSQRPDLAAVFRCELNKALNIPDQWDGALGIEPRNRVEHVLINAMLRSIRAHDPRFVRFRDGVFRALAEPCRLVGQDLIKHKEMKEAWRQFVGEAMAVGFAFSPEVKSK